LRFQGIDGLAALEIDEDASAIHGRVVNANAVLTFEGETLSELRTAFADRLSSGLAPRTRLAPESGLPSCDMSRNKKSMV
jgi:predicted HicB family RNase H-like nuclease